MFIFLELKNNFEKNDNYSFDLFEIASKIDSFKHKKTENKSKNGIIFFQKDRFNQSGFYPFIQKLAKFFANRKRVFLLF